MAVAAAVALCFLLRDLCQSLSRSVPDLGWTGTLTGPIFAHKVSELVIGGGWFFVAVVGRHERAGLWPGWITRKGYGAFLRASAVAVSVATVLATYAWTITNLGTSPLTTNVKPLTLRPDEGWLWRYYLGALVIAGTVYILVMGRKGLEIGWREARAALLILLFLGAPGRVLAQPPNRYAVAGIDNAAAAERFLRGLQRAVARNERGKVAGMVDYPLRVTIDGRKRTLNRRADLLRRYDLVFNRKVRQSLARQKAGDLFVNWRGVMIGSGEIWFGPRPEGKTLRIIAINN